MKTSIMLFLMIALNARTNSFAQNSTYNIDPTTKQITNWNTRYNFKYLYTYDFDLKQSSQTYDVDLIVVIEVNSEGKGRFVSSLGGEKTILTLASCFLNTDTFVFNCFTLDGKKITANMSLKNNRVDKFWVTNSNNVAVVYSN